jgi:polyphosphate kinase
MHERYNNRELSWLEFNERVLEEAADRTNPIMERMKFLAISASNLDEFFMIRVSSLKRNRTTKPDFSGMTPQEQLQAISKRAHDMAVKQYSTFMRSLLPQLEKDGIRLLSYAELSTKQREEVDIYFDKELYQLLTPMAIDQSRPFPAINNRTVNIFIQLEGERDKNHVRAVHWNEDENRWQISEERASAERYALVQLPTIVPRILPITGGSYILIESIILAHISRLFVGHIVTRTAIIRVTRNSDLHIDEEEIDDLLNEMAKATKGRRWGRPVRLELSRGMGKRAMRLLTNALQLSDDDIYVQPGPLDLSEFMRFAARPEFEHLRHQALQPQPVPDFLGQPGIFDVIRKRDVLVHHPYQSFDCVTRFIREAAADENVLAIKHTLYRVSGNSPIIKALIQAAENGKQVSVLVELKARFDEENNIQWARLMEKAGVHVIYGLIGLKTHCKVCLVVRREDGTLRRYLHMGTGNYNEATAKIYTDIGLFTCRESFGRDASMLFNVLTGYSKNTKWEKFAVAPHTLRPALLSLIGREIANANAGKPAAITARMNALSDTEMINLLYDASTAGVKIRLLVRGICCLRPGIAGLSENITVSSIVDRYLEHSRVFIFENGGKPRIYLSSADLMSRNLNRRVELMFPVEDAALKKQLTSIVELSLSDNVKRRDATPDGTYVRPDRRGRAAVQSQLQHHANAADAYAAKALEVMHV